MCLYDQSINFGDPLLIYLSQCREGAKRTWKLKSVKALKALSLPPIAIGASKWVNNTIMG